MNSFMLKTFKQAKRVIIGVIGTTVLLIGLALIVLPGPAFIVIPIGLAILATEFAWAKRLLKKFRPQNSKKTNNTKKSR
ncbi:MAG: PGPGW domain-containing protein [Nitrospirae bacterium]|nr:PGPGW domain-containing protein [Nitrospirota bacterium]